MPEPIGKSSSDPGPLACTDPSDSLDESNECSVKSAAPPPPAALTCALTAGAAELIEKHADNDAAKANRPDGRRGLVFNVGISAAVESTLTSLVAPAANLPGGAAVATGYYFDFRNLEVGTYRRTEVREGAGAYGGIGVEAGVTDAREDFDGTSAALFGDGGVLGRLGIEVTSGGASLGAGVGEGAAAGAALSTTTTKPIYSLESGFDAMSPFRRGP